jgi:hypothetical protein
MEHKVSTQAVKTQLRGSLLKATAEQRPEMLIRMALLCGAAFDEDMDRMAIIVDELLTEFDISDASVLEAIEATPMLSEVWPKG